LNGVNTGFDQYIKSAGYLRTLHEAIDPAVAKHFFNERLEGMGLDTAAFAQHEIEGFSPEFKYVSTPGLSRLENVTVLSGEWVIHTQDSAYLNYCVQSPYPPVSAYFAPFGLMHPKVQHADVEAAFLLGGCTNYCHWLFDFLPRLLMLPEHLRSVPMLVNGDFTRFQEASVQALGLQLNLLKLNYPHACKVRNLLVMNIESGCTLPPFKPEIVRLVRAAFERYFSPGPATRKLWISRAAQKHSRLANSEEAQALAVSRGFEVVHLEHLPFVEQVRLFSEAAVVAGPHGAGFSNMVFAPAGTRLIELMSSEFDQSYQPEVMFSFIGQVLGQRVQRLIGTSVGTCDAHLVNQRYHADLTALDSALSGD
jgi:hypothetical protein